MKQHMENALKIAQWLEANPRIEKVIYACKFNVYVRLKLFFLMFVKLKCYPRTLNMKL